MVNQKLARVTLGVLSMLLSALTVGVFLRLSLPQRALCQLRTLSFNKNRCPWWPLSMN